MKIPKILHVMWIGRKPAPLNMMMSWKKKNPDFEFIFWNEAEITKRGLVFKCMKQINDIQEICGKCDIMRWEILYEYGGVFVDADSICIEPIDDVFMNKQAFATYENENTRKDLVALGILGFIPNHPLCRDIINWISDSALSEAIIRDQKAWMSVGNARLTTLLNTGNYPDFSIFPSYYVLPIHHTGLVYEGHGKVYANQLWGSSNDNYDTMNDIKLSKEFDVPVLWFSVLIPSYNTKREFLRNCLDSIKNQNGHFGIELVWINDGSDQDCTNFLEEELYNFGKNTRFIKIKYIRFGKNKGICESLNIGVQVCSNEYIFRMDSDDIMFPNRLKIQYAFMISHPDAVVCGGGIRIFNDGPIRDIFHEQKISWTEYINQDDVSTWIMNHPTLCYKKSAVLSVGNYNTDFIRKPFAEDYELELRLMKRFGCLYNIDEVLIYYRVHEDQVTIKYKDLIESTLNNIYINVKNNIEIDL